ncbi:isoprenoid synthase domain-containing protein [Aspergillus venezuelensis]
MSSEAITISKDAVQQSGCVSLWPPLIHPCYRDVNDDAIKLTREYNAELQTKLTTHTTAQIPKFGPAHITALTIPHCRDDRLSLMTRFCELIFLNDDYCDDTGTDRVALSPIHHLLNSSIQLTVDCAAKVQAYRNQLQAFFSSNIKDDSQSPSAKSQQMQVRLLFEMLDVDHTLAVDLMASYSRILQTPHPPKNADMASMADYLAFRASNPTLQIFQDMCCFGMGLKLTEVEKKKLDPIVNACHHSTVLINDYWSWPREVSKYLKEPAKGFAQLPLNAVCIMMQEHSCSEAEAQQKVLDEVVNHQQIHLRMIDEMEKQEGPLCEKFRLYLSAVQHTASGFEYWNSHSTRYPKKHDYEQGECYLEDGHLKCKPFLPSHNGKPVSSNQCANCGTDKHGLQNGFSIKSHGSNHDVPGPTSALEDTHFACVAENGHVHPNKNNLEPRSNTLPNGSSFKEFHEPHSGLQCEFVQAPDNAVLAPYEYLATLPSKNIRDMFIDALNIWLQVPRPTLSRIKKIITLLHHASLMVDDIEDNSVLRRGKPSTHVLYGEAQTINSANHAFVNAFAEVQHLCHPSAPAVFVREVQNMHCGQALDLSWKYETYCPTVDEYMMMIDNKTGAMFRLCVQLMQGESSNPCKHIDPNHFVTQLGRYFQVRDDYQNLVSAEYTDQKGFCEDLDEGKISLPLIYTLSNPKSEAAGSVIKGILQNRSNDGLPVPVKKYILEQMEKAGALNDTLSLAREMQGTLIEELHRLEDAFGSKNPLVEMILRRLWV